ncbi:MAG TPA: zf-HC2 domain-containing protein [Gemmatimonadales bacterium]|nr:zf-HC2 domain-containing protein [Gemmatimonadales bacterium]
MSDQFTNQLSAYLDGELERESRRRLEAHLAACVECSALLADLRAIVAAAPHYEGRQPSRDLWKDIEPRLDEAEVIPISIDRPTARPSVRRFSWPQLIAASLVMAAVGGGATFLVLRQNTTPPAAVAVDLPNRRSAPLPDSVKTVEYAEAQYDAAVKDLESVLAAGRSQLDTATVRTIEQSLQKIDAAIAEARIAIQRDPANAYLSRQIAANMRRKLDLLRAATNAITART